MSRRRTERIQRALFQPVWIVKINPPPCPSPSLPLSLPHLQIRPPQLVGPRQKLEGALIKQVALDGLGLCLGVEVPEPALEGVGVAGDFLVEEGRGGEGGREDGG